jgi:hypothetical protein
VITTKFTMIRIAKTITPITKLPPITKCPKASMTWPAAAVPSCPRARMSRVEARLSASLSIVAMRSTVGKDENSSGSSMNSEVIRISTERMIESANSRSRRSGGNGKTSTTRMPMTPIASSRSERFARAPMSSMVGSAKPTPAPPPAPPMRRRVDAPAFAVAMAAGAMPAADPTAAAIAAPSFVTAAALKNAVPRQTLPSTWLAGGWPWRAACDDVVCGRL